ncbi:hypothetical protein Dacsa_0657 [Dactylococcopsis salina PCC 8305]|uniref:Uncharacterized protein n=2 Tax=Dactylococcopsis salina TaxID=292566 RepID=K9YR91_DACS8|nr:hypothetical protein Dacsa_0657 [Dactylococcopsis salina PCC 8305]
MPCPPYETIEQGNILNIMNGLNSEEKEILESVEKEEWKSVENLSQEIKRYQTYASHQINQQKIEVNLSVEDSQKFQDQSRLGDNQ